MRASNEWWLKQNNVEGLVCGIPTFEDVLDGVHRVIAVGNDGMGVHITVDTGKSDEAGDQAEVVQLVYLSRLLRHFRMSEAGIAPGPYS